MPDWRPNVGMPITDLFAWVATEANGGQVVASAWLPVLACSVALASPDLVLVRSWRCHAEDYRNATGCAVRLMRYSLAEGLEEIP
jgi:hypothetical protein